MESKTIAELYKGFCGECRHCKKVPFAHRCALDTTKSIWPMSTKQCDKFERPEPLKEQSGVELEFARMRCNAIYSGMTGIIG